MKTQTVVRFLLVLSLLGLGAGGGAEDIPTEKISVDDTQDNKITGVKKGPAEKAKETGTEPRAVIEKEALVKFCRPYRGGGVPSAVARELNLRGIKKEAALVYYRQATWQLAREIASVLNREHLLARALAGLPVRIHGVILVKSRSDLPPEFHYRTWANIDSVPCLIAAQEESSLPLKNDTDAYMLFHLLIHEAVNLGIKEECLGGRLAGRNRSGRWWVEGIADYCAWRACGQYQRNAFNRRKGEYLEGLAGISKSHLDLAEEKTWWPEGAEVPSGEAAHAYAAAFYVIATLADRHDERWIAGTLARIKQEGKADETTSADFCRIAAAETGEDIEKLIRNVDLEKARKYLERL